MELTDEGLHICRLAFDRPMRRQTQAEIGKRSPLDVIHGRFGELDCFIRQKRTKKIRLTGFVDFTYCKLKLYFVHFSASYCALLQP